MDEKMKERVIHIENYTIVHEYRELVELAEKENQSQLRFKEFKIYFAYTFLKNTWKCS